MLGTLTRPAPPQQSGPLAYAHHTHQRWEVSVRTQAQGGEKGIGVGGFTLPRPTGHTDLII